MEDCTNDPSSELTGGPKTYVHILAPEPVNVTLFGERVFADVLKLRILRGGYPGLPGRTLNLMTSVLIRDRRGDTDTQRRRPREDRGRDRSDADTSQGSWKRLGRTLS